MTFPCSFSPRLLSNKGMQHLSSMKKKNVVLLYDLLLEMLDANTTHSSRMSATHDPSNNDPTEPPAAPAPAVDTQLQLPFQNPEESQTLESISTSSQDAGQLREGRCVPQWEDTAWDMDGDCLRL